MALASSKSVSKPTIKSGSATINTDEVSNGKNNVVELVIKENSPHHYDKRFSSENLKGQGNQITFLSTKKSLMLFADDVTYIVFKNYVFTTNNPETIEYLRSHEAYGNDIFEGDYPDHVKKAIAEKRKYFTKDKSEHGG